MNTEILLNDVKSYATEANLRKALAKLGLDNWARYMVTRTADGRWTAIFMVTEYLNRNGGYAGFASQHGFMSL